MSSARLMRFSSAWVNTLILSSVSFVAAAWSALKAGEIAGLAAGCTLAGPKRQRRSAIALAAMRAGKDALMALDTGPADETNEREEV
ncbi:hypothetical protein B7H23_01365 [Notoacmeibacter marinus]|uniref:Uncharacterized protein n=1 Tax=Notoacmeibacter marinus TaxID=1876515 RepID=A0A231V0A7_9HYPH|nr:hypothetical protein B7H23_01365 [Notoacmeibacter marinus]